MGHQGPNSVPGPRVIAVEEADVKQVLENDVKRRNERMVLLVMWSGHRLSLN